MVLALTLVLVCAAMYGAFYQSLLSQVDHSLQTSAQEAIREAGDDQAHFGREGYEGGFFALVVGADGRVLENPQRVQLSNLALSRAKGPIHFETAAVNGTPTRLYIHALAAGPWAGSDLVIGESLAPEQDALNRLLLVVLAVGSAGLLTALVAAWFLSGKALGPIQIAFERQQQFTADASHELRTPLTVMQTATDLMAQHQDEPLRNSGDLLEDLRSEITRLERIAGDLLTLARSDVGKLDLAVGDVNLAGLAAAVVRRLTPLAVEHQVTLRLTTPERLAVEADPDRIEQVLIILLDNALNHTQPGGEVTVSVRQQGHDAVVTVRDNGEGISPEHLDHIFDRFYRADRARGRSRAGAGLGLAIARALVSAHDGQLTIQSSPGEGTSVTVRLRLPASPSLAARLAQLTSRQAHP